jgi:hypothetical protein
MSEAGEDFRLTKDIDMVLIVEALSPEFWFAVLGICQSGGLRTPPKKHKHS